MDDIQTTATPTKAPDTAVGGESHLDLGNGGASFDDFDSIDAALINEAKVKKDDAKKIEKKIKDTEKEEKSSLPKGKSEETDKPKKKEAKESKEEAPKITKAKEAEIKKLIARWEDQDIEVPFGAKFKHKVDGQEVELSLSDALNNYSGKVSWEKKFSEVDRARKSVESREANIQSKMNKFKELVTSEEVSPLDAYDWILDQIPVNKHNTLKRLKESLYPDMHAYMELSDEGRRAYDAEQENSFLRKESETYAKSKAEAQQGEILRQQMGSIKEKTKLSEEQLYSAFKLLEEKKIPFSNLQEVADYADGMRVGAKARGLIKEVNPDLVGEERLYKEVMDMLDEGEYSLEEIKEVIAETTLSARDAKKYLESVQSKDTTPKHVQTKASDKLELFEDFEY